MGIFERLINPIVDRYIKRCLLMNMVIIQLLL